MISDWIMSLRKCEKLIAPRTSKRVVCGFRAGAEAAGEGVPRRAVELFCMGARR